MSIRISLDVPALEKLLKDDDGTISLEMRNAVVQNFANHHLKPLLNSQASKLIQDTVTLGQKQMIEEMVGKIKQTGAYNRPVVELRPEIKDAIQMNIEDTYAKLIQNVIIKVVDDIDLEAMVERKINSVMSGRIEQLVKTKVQERLNAIQKAAMG